MALLNELIKLAEQDEEVVANTEPEAPVPEPKADLPADLDNQETADDELDLDGSTENEDPDRQGLIRTVKNAHLVFKRANPDGKFSELWIYNINKNSIDDELRVKKDILAGTDIPNNATTSPDETQTYELVTMGNAQLLYIDGLPN